MSTQQWNDFMAFAATYAKTVDMAAEEDDYKLVLTERLAKTRELFLAKDAGWFEVLRKDISSTNLMNQYFMMRLVEIGRTQPDDLWEIINLLWQRDEPAVSHIDEFTERLRPFNPKQLSVGGIVGFASLLLMTCDPHQYPPYRAQAVKKFLKLVGWDDRGSNGTPSRRYALLLEALDEILRLAPDYALDVHDRLSAQGLLWTVMNVDPDDSWSAEEATRLRVWRGDKMDAAGTLLVRKFGPCPDVEAAGQLIIDAGMRGEPSPFWPQGCSWTEQNAAEMIKRIYENFDGGDDPFMAKIERQLEGASVGLYVLAAEFMALHMLPLVNVRGETKLARIETLLRWSGADLQVPEAIKNGLFAKGAFNGGTGFNVRMWRHFCWLARFVQVVRQRSAAELEDDLADPRKFDLLTEAVPDDPLGIKYSLEYLAWPSYFEPITSRTHRERIQKAFSSEIGGTTGTSDPDISWDLYRIRQAHEKAANGAVVDWYLEPYVSQWMKGGVTGQRAWLVRQNQGGIALLNAWLDGQFVSTRAQHLGSPKPGASFDDIQAAVNLGYQHIDYSERKARAQEYFRFLSQMKPDDYVVTAAEGELYLGMVSGEAEYAEDEASRLRRPVDWQPKGIGSEDLPAPLPRLLEEQGTVVDLTDALSVVAPWFASDLDLPEEKEDVAPQPQLAVVPVLREATPELARKLYVPRDDLQEIVRLLQTRQQIVFYGPPGTGKTFLAGKIARFLAGEEHGDHVKTVQFHPSYAYEDFFEGYRPAKTEGGNVGFVLEPGPLRRIAAEAAADGNRDKPYFLIIDEMNRGNLAKIFGELYFLLEYREQSINLQYNSEQTFVLPPNLFIIGTMNTSDRSIAMVDAAIRRRFAFVELHPQEGMISGMLERFLEGNGKPLLRAELLNALNAEIEDTSRDLMIGPSYFMKAHAESEQGLSDIWKYELLPLLEEQYFGRLNREKVHEKFGLPAILKKVQSTVGAVDMIVSDVAAAADLGNDTANIVDPVPADDDSIV
ncbi:McrB family protein [Arthrobacter dokdonensis]|uniref:McrB family protein n=1 Tax=Arthrobacter dokdonellae TaxID=2211210 RepID=UPI000DE5935E|nr:AAA family ATPase [Arthrobacter dokdonellae]